jgi:predicted transcriptional regulator
MNTVELKLELIAQIVATNDSILLDKIKETINSYESNLSVNEPTSTYEKVASEKIYIFNEWQQKRIDIALKQVENGEYLTEEEDEKEMKKWFEEEDEKLSGQ